ncbi:MAG: hypothetical protein U1F49_03615 [Rubrivivax sp.]
MQSVAGGLKTKLSAATSSAHGAEAMASAAQASSAVPSQRSRALVGTMAASTLIGSLTN